MWISNDYDRAALHIVTMLDRGWFDDAVGRVEGRDIFERLMRSGDLGEILSRILSDVLSSSDNLRRRVVNLGIVTILVKKLEGGNCHEVRVSLSCLDSLGAFVNICSSTTHLDVPGKHNPLDLSQTVTESVSRLKDKDEKVRKKGVKVLGALAQTCECVLVTRCDMTNELAKWLVRKL